MPQDVYRDVKGASPAGEGEDVAKALGAAEDALDAGDHDTAIRALEWAKAVASRSWAVREAIGIAYYLAGRYRDAHRELVTYRRLSGRDDQNHLLADCARAAGDRDKAREYVEAMIASGVDEARVVEGLLVVAGDRAEHGDVEGALRALGRVARDPAAVGEHHLRLWLLAAELHDRIGDESEARRLRESIAEVDPGFLEGYGD